MFAFEGEGVTVTPSQHESRAELAAGCGVWWTGKMVVGDLRWHPSSRALLLFRHFCHIPYTTARGISVPALDLGAVCSATFRVASCVLLLAVSDHCARELLLRCSEIEISSYEVEKGETSDVDHYHHGASGGFAFVNLFTRFAFLEDFDWVL